MTDYGWIVGANLVLWTGLFLALLRIESRLSRGNREERP